MCVCISYYTPFIAMKKCNKKYRKTFSDALNYVYLHARIIKLFKINFYLSPFAGLFLLPQVFMASRSSQRKKRLREREREARRMQGEIFFYERGSERDIHKTLQFQSGSSNLSSFSEKRINFSFNDIHETERV
jgi:hypothetical protein